MNFINKTITCLKLTSAYLILRIIFPVPESSEFHKYVS